MSIITYCMSLFILLTTCTKACQKLGLKVPTVNIEL
jgi:hypothetical protein